MPKALSLSIVIPAYNEEGYLKACLDSIAAQTVKPDEVIVVDNNSSDQTIRIAKQYDFVKVIHEVRQGIAFARNAGFNFAKSDIIARIDADTRLSKTWINQIKNYFKEKTDVEAITGVCGYYDAPLKSLVRLGHGLIYGRVQSQIAGVTVLWGSNMAIRKQTWETVKADCCTQCPWEDIDLSLALKKAKANVRRETSLRAEVSLRRGNLSPVMIARYLAPWSKPYWHRRQPLRAMAIDALNITTLLALMPSAALYTLIKTLSN